jgi:hypothetical protein
MKDVPSLPGGCGGLDVDVDVWKLVLTPVT